MYYFSARNDQELLRQRRAMQVAGFVAALFMENLDGTIIVTALPQMARFFGADPVGLNTAQPPTLLLGD